MSDTIIPRRNIVRQYNLSGYIYQVECIGSFRGTETQLSRLEKWEFARDRSHP